MDYQFSVSASRRTPIEAFFNFGVIVMSHRNGNNRSPRYAAAPLAAILILTGTACSTAIEAANAEKIVACEQNGNLRFSVHEAASEVPVEDVDVLKDSVARDVSKLAARVIEAGGELEFQDGSELFSRTSGN